jgi:hypothetical protein
MMNYTEKQLYKKMHDYAGRNCRGIKNSTVIVNLVVALYRFRETRFIVTGFGGRHPDWGGHENFDIYYYMNKNLMSVDARELLNIKAIALLCIHKSKVVI